MIPDPEDRSDAADDGIPPPFSSALLDDLAKLARDGQRFRAINRLRWDCISYRRDANELVLCEETNVADAISDLDGSDEALDRLRAAVDAMIDASTQENE